MKTELLFIPLKYQQINKMKIMLLFIIISYLVSACNPVQKKVKLGFVNKSEKVIASIRVSSYNFKVTLINILPNKNYEKEFEIINRGPGESAFLTSIFIKDSIVFQGTFGYHSSLNDMKPNYKIKINPDYTISEN